MEKKAGANSGLRHLYADHLGSTSAIQHPDGSVDQTRYTPFGGYRNGGPSQITDRAFTGQKENMALGLYYYNARYYAPSLGRFLSADTLVPDPQNPQSLNRFSYTRNNPLNYLDPTGHRDIDTDSGGGGIITGDKAFMIYALTIAAVASQNPEVREFVENIPKGAQNVWDSCMAAMSGDDSSANAQQSQNLGEIAGHTASSPGDFDPKDEHDNDTESWLDNVRQEANVRIPDSWDQGASKGRGAGWRWSDPNNPSGNYVRIDRGNPYSSDPVQQVDHVHIRYNGSVIRADGSPVPSGIKSSNIPDTHTPLEEWLNWNNWFSP